MKKFLLIFVLTSSIANAQWKPDRADYEVLKEGNFWTTAHDMQTALSIALNTLEYNGAKMHTLNITRKTSTHHYSITSSKIPNPDLSTSPMSQEQRQVM